MISIKNHHDGSDPVCLRHAHLRPRLRFDWPRAVRRLATTFVVRDRKAITGADMGLVQGYFPGTTAWRPPTC